MEVRTENVGSGGGYGWGGDGILGLIALLSIFRGNLWGGNYGEANGNLNEIQNQLSNIRADIGDVKYDSVSTTLNQTIGLMSELANGRIENLQTVFNQTTALQNSLCGIEKDVLNAKFELGSAIAASGSETNLNIVRMGYENQLANCAQTNTLTRQIADCCCETNGNIRETAFQTQLRDLEYKCSTDSKLNELACGQKAIIDKINESRLLDENARLKDKIDVLREKEERSFIAASAGRTNALITQLGDANKAFYAATTPATPYPWDIPTYLY